MTLLTNINKVAFASQYAVDKIVTSKPFTGSFTVGGYDNVNFNSGTGSTVVTHNLGRKCFPELLWSTDATNYHPAPQEDTNGIGVLAACNDNTCTIYAYQGIGTTAKTVYYILYLLWPN